MLGHVVTMCVNEPSLLPLAFSDSGELTEKDLLFSLSRVWASSPPFFQPLLWDAMAEDQLDSNP